MNNRPHHHSRRQIALALILPLMLAACGGEESSDIVSSTDPAIAAGRHSAQDTIAELTRHGMVSLPEGVADALVCLDIKGSGICDAGAQPTARTHADGSYVIRYQPMDAADAEDFKAAALLAEISSPEGSYTLSSPGKQSDDINPLTTLVYRQVLQATPLDAAEQQVARQLDIEVDAIYHPDRSSVALAAASLTNYALRNGIPTLIPAAAQAQDDTAQLVSLRFKDIHNYEYDVHTPEGSANAAGQTLWRPVYGGRINGNDRTQQDAAYTARAIDGFTSTGREEYLRRGVLKLFAADNQFTPVLLNRQATAKSAKHSLDASAAGYAVETTVQKMNISGQSIRKFFDDPACYRNHLKGAVHLDTFKIEDTSVLARSTFPEGSVLHVRISTPVGNQHSIQYKQSQNGTAWSVSRTASASEKTLEQKGNDLNPVPQQHAPRALVVTYALNERAWSATKAALNLP